MMSEQAFLFVGVLGTFATTILVGMRLVVARQSRRAAAVLEGHLETAGVVLPVNRGEGSFGDRVMKPTASRLSALVSRYTPVGARDTVARKLALAGIESGLS